MRPTARESGTIGVEQKSPILTPGVANRVPVCRNGEVAGGDELAAGRGGDAVHLCDHRLRYAVNRLHHHRADVEELLVERGVATDHLAQIVPGGERRAGALDHDRPHVRDRADLVERRDQLFHQRQRERVPLLGPVERDPGSRRLDADEQVLAGRGGHHAER